MTSPAPERATPISEAVPRGEPHEAPAGVVYALLAYGWWGLTPVYWKALESVPVLEVLAHRVIWALVVSIGAIALARRGSELAALVRSRPRLLWLVASAGLIAINWLVYIFAVNTDQVLAASLGYYLNPLISVALGAVVLGERLRPAQWVAVALAGVGVAILALDLGSLPWISITLALSFALYGLIRKTLPSGSAAALSIETAVLAPLALAWICYGELAGSGALATGSSGTRLLLFGSGVATALPLIWFASATRRLRLSTVGLFQYLAPTLNFALAVFLYGEAFTTTHALTFGCIWVALLVYAIAALRGDVDAS